MSDYLGGQRSAWERARELGGDPMLDEERNQAAIEAHLRKLGVA